MTTLRRSPPQATRPDPSGSTPTRTAVERSPSSTLVADAGSRSLGGSGLGLARAALIVGLLYAGVSVFWGLGGTWLLDTVGGSLTAQGRAGDAGALLAVWAAVLAKTIAALLPLTALRGLPGRRSDNTVRALAWMAAAILTVYGLAQTVAGVLVQADVIHASAGADHRALAWHAYLWDPWFLIWGLLATAALVRHRYRRPHD